MATNDIEPGHSVKIDDPLHVWEERAYVVPIKSGVPYVIWGCAGCLAEKRIEQTVPFKVYVV